MANKVFIHAYNMGSESAKALADATGFKRIKLEGSRFKGGNDKTVINWGCSKLPDEVMKCRVINVPYAVSIASNKLKFFNRIAEYNEIANDEGRVCVEVPAITTDKADALNWVKHGSIVVARTVLNGNSGEGIVIVEKEEDMVDAPLYVLYIPKKQEYRIHVRNGEVVDVQRKARRKDLPDDKVNWRVRNHDNGFIFARNDVACPEGVTKQAVLAVEAVGLDFGAVDIIFNDKYKKAIVLEINTAPGLTGTTLDGYANAFKELDV